MKHILHFLNILFRLRGQIIIGLLLLSTITIAQEQTPPTGEFPVGTQIGESFVNIPAMRDTLAASGLTELYHRADNDRKTFLEDYNLLAVNTWNKFEYIHHYSTCFYSKWEAEQNLTGEDTARVGFKHKAGNPAYWYDPELNDTILCWSTEGLSAPACSLMYGPHYRQEKGYKRQYNTRWELAPVPYVVRFNMALSNPQSVSGSEDVCKIKVVFRYKDLRDGQLYDAEFKSRVLKVSDFNQDSSFKDIYFDENPTLRSYKYPDSFYVPGNVDKIVEPPEGTINYRDWESFTGIQYWVEWLRTDALCNLYINFVELYDNDGWNEYLSPLTHDEVVQNIQNYAQSFKNNGWDNIIYWSGVDEPYVIDAYAPQHIVDSLIRSVQAPPLINTFNPSWTWDQFSQNELEIIHEITITNQQKLLFNNYPKEFIIKKYLRFEDLK